MKHLATRLPSIEYSSMLSLYALSNLAINLTASPTYVAPISICANIFRQLTGEGTISVDLPLIEFRLRQPSLIKKQSNPSKARSSPKRIFCAHALYDGPQTGIA